MNDLIKEKVLKKKITSEFDAFAKEFDFWLQTTASASSYDKILIHLPQGASFSLALDAGCGSGYLAFKLADQINHVVGVDNSCSMIEMAKNKKAEQKRENVDLAVADIEKLPFGEETFDFVVSVIALLSTRLEVKLPQLRRLVRPGGRMVVYDIITPDPQLTTSSLYWVILALKKASRYFRSYGFSTMWRLLSFEVKPAWIRARCRAHRLTSKEFKSIYSHWLPGCRFESHDRRITVIWEAPEKKFSSEY
jgi:ubiquinone/menaquinone biosynthesis C-methylase UbiE